MGYASIQNWPLDETIYGGCYKGTLNSPDPCELEATGRVKGDFFSAIAKISKDGRQRLWYKRLIFGAFWNVIQTTDGGYIAVGNADGTLDENNNPLKYNPTATSPSDEFTSSNQSCSVVGSTHSRHALVVKFNFNGDVLWRYIYGYENYSNSTGGQNAYAIQSLAYNVI